MNLDRWSTTGRFAMTAWMGHVPATIHHVRNGPLQENMGRTCLCRAAAESLQAENRHANNGR